MWQSFGASKAPVQMRMSPSWRQTDRQNHKGREDRQTYIDEKNEKREKKSKRAIKKRGELLVSETMTFLPIESDG